jgi:hypothetical protein
MPAQEVWVSRLAQCCAIRESKPGDCMVWGTGGKGEIGRKPRMTIDEKGRPAQLAASMSTLRGKANQSLRGHLKNALQAAIHPAPPTLSLVECTLTSSVDATGGRNLTTKLRNS